MDELTEEEKIKLKTLCEFVFFGLESNTTTYEKFERCFQPLFNDNIRINLYDAYTSMIGDKKKYLTYPRFVNAYLRYKEYKKKEPENNNDLSIFFSSIFDKIFKGINGFVGNHKDFDFNQNKNIICLSTKRGTSNNDNPYKESFISSLEVKVNSQDIINGIIIEYDNIDLYKLYDEENNEKILIGLRIKSRILDEDLLKEVAKQKYLEGESINKILFQDSITHIFGTIDKDTQTINFLGFKCFSGKMRYIGKPKGESFLFGEFGKRFYNLRLEIDIESGITLFEPGFINNESLEYFKQKFKKDIEEISTIDVNKNIFEESIFKNLDMDQLNFTITTDFEEDEYLFEQEGDENKGYDYKEIINLSNRSWIINEEKRREEKKEDKSENFQSLKLKIHSVSEGDPSNRMNILENEKKELYSYNLNPFLKYLRKALQVPDHVKDGEMDFRTIQNEIKNPFFHIRKKESKNDNIQIIFHRAITKYLEKEKESKDQVEINPGKIKDNKKLNEIFKNTSFKNKIKELYNNNIHGKLMNELFKEENNNLSLIPFHIFDEVIPIEVDERDKNEIEKKVENKKELKLNGEIIKCDEPLIKKSNDNIKKELEQLDEAYFQEKLKILKNDIMNELKKDENIKILIELFENQDNKEKIKLAEKIKCNQMLSDKKYEKIVNILTQNVKVNEKSDASYFQNKLKILKDEIMNELKEDEIIKILFELFENQENREKIELVDKIKYYQILSDKNYEKIVNFSTQNEKSDAAYFWDKLKIQKIQKNEIVNKPKEDEIINNLIELFEKLDNKEKIELVDKIKYYRILSDKKTEEIAKILTQNVKVNNNNENINKKDNDKILDYIKSLKKLKDYEKKIKELTEQKNSSKENELNKIKIYKNKYIKDLEQSLLNEDEKIQDIYDIYNGFKKKELNESRGFRAIETARDLETWQIGPNINNSNYLENDVDLEQEEIEKNVSYYLNQKEIKTDKDPEFIPEKNSLCPIEQRTNEWFRPLPYKVRSSDITNWENIDWRTIIGKEIFLKNSPSLKNMRQGEYIGDCYFLSALGALCERKDYLKKLIKRIEIGSKSVGYKIKLNLNGKWKYILVDKYFPYIKEKDMFCFGCSFKNELWVSLFEKAWAKVNGCYARIGCGGECGDGFDVLTSAISEFHEILEINDKKKDELWEILKDAKNKKNNYLIGAGTRRLGFFERIFGQGLGLISSHAYTIINVYEKKYENEIIKLVKLRNPWGEKEYNGDWSDKSSKWNDKLKKMFEFEGVKDDGIFYMSYNDFTYYFRSLEILKIRENYEIRASSKISKNEAYKMQIIKFHIEKKEQKRENKIKVFINLYQKNPRIRRKNGTYFPDPTKGFLILAKKEVNGKYIFIKAKTAIKAHIAIEEDLDINTTYIIFCDVNYRFIYDELYGYNITFYCDKSYEVSAKNITNKFNGQESSEILTQILYDYYRKNKENNFEKKEVKKGWTFWAETIFNVYKLKHFNEDFPFVILYVENGKPEYKDYYFRLDLDFSKLNDKVACIYNDSEASEFDISVCKKITDRNKIILIMGYTLTDVYNYNYDYEEKKTNNFIFDKKPEKKGLLNQYKVSAEKDKGFIIGLENPTKKKLIFDFRFYGLNIINPQYNNKNNNEQNIFQDLTLKERERKVIYLRLQPNIDNPTFDTDVKN